MKIYQYTACGNRVRVRKLHISPTWREYNISGCGYSEVWVHVSKPVGTRRAVYALKAMTVDAEYRTFACPLFTLGTAETLPEAIDKAGEWLLNPIIPKVHDGQPIEATNA